MDNQTWREDVYLFFKDLRDATCNRTSPPPNLQTWKTFLPVLISPISPEDSGNAASSQKRVHIPAILLKASVQFGRLVLGAKKSTQTFFVHSFPTTLRVMDVRAENHGRPHQKVRFPAAPLVGRNFLTPGHPGVRVRNVRGKSGPKSLYLFRDEKLGP